MRKAVSAALAFCFVLLPALFASDLVSSQVNFTANLGSAGSANIALTVLARQGPPSGETILMVPGFAQSATTFDALARGMFQPDFGNKISRVIVLDHPGHGASGYPSVSAAFGFLSIDHYASVLLQALAALNAQGVRPTLLLGHSMGGEIVMMAQQQLIDHGSSLHDSFGIDGAILIAPAMPSPLPWAFADGGAAIPILSSFVRSDPALGQVVDFPPFVWVPLFYQDPTGAIPSGAPSPSDAAARHYISLEPLAVGLELLGLSPFPGRPAVSAGLFDRDKGTAAGVIAMGRDFLFTPSEQQALYAFVTNDAKLKFFSIVDDASAVHDMYTFNPGPMLHAIKKVLNASQASSPGTP